MNGSSAFHWLQSIDAFPLTHCRVNTPSGPSRHSPNGNPTSSPNKGLQSESCNRPPEKCYRRPCNEEAGYSLVVVGGREWIPCHEHSSTLHLRLAVTPHVDCARAVTRTCAVEQPTSAPRAWPLAMSPAVHAPGWLLVPLALGAYGVQ